MRKAIPGVGLPIAGAMHVALSDGAAVLTQRPQGLFVFYAFCDELGIQAVGQRGCRSDDCDGSGIWSQTCDKDLVEFQPHPFHSHSPTAVVSGARVEPNPELRGTPFAMRAVDDIASRLGCSYGVWSLRPAGWRLRNSRK